MADKNQSRDVTKRHEFADYLNIGSEETPDFVLLGTGVTKLDERTEELTKETFAGM